MPLIELKDATSRLYDYVIAGMFIHSATTEMLYLRTLIIRRRCKCDRTLKDVGSDYVIGCQTAGLVLAARLSEDPGTSVLVLEAGELKENDSLIRECD